MVFIFLAYFTLYNGLQFHPSHQNWFKWILYPSWKSFGHSISHYGSFHLICHTSFYLLLAALGLCCCTWALYSCSGPGLLSSCGVWASHRSVFSCCRALALGRSGFSSYCTWAQLFSCTGLIVLWNVGSSWTRDQTWVPCTGRWILNHWTTREVPNVYLLYHFL